MLARSPSCLSTYSASWKYVRRGCIVAVLIKPKNVHYKLTISEDLVSMPLYGSELWDQQRNGPSPNGLIIINMLTRSWERYGLDTAVIYDDEM